MIVNFTHKKIEDFFIFNNFIETVKVATLEEDPEIDYSFTKLRVS